MKNKFLVFPLQCLTVAVLALLLAAPRAAFAQDHVVSPGELQQDLANASAARQRNRESVESFLSSAQARRALESAHVNYEQVNQAIGQLSDGELAMLAQRSANAQTAFAAGAIGGSEVVLIVVGVALLILLIAVAT